LQFPKDLLGVEQSSVSKLFIWAEHKTVTTATGHQKGALGLCSSSQDIIHPTCGTPGSLQKNPLVWKPS